MWRLCLALKEHSAHRRSEEEEEAQRVAKITGNSIEKKFSFSFFFVFFFFIFILFSFSNLCETMRTCRRNVCKRCGNRMPDKYTTYNGKRWTKKKKKITTNEWKWQNIKLNKRIVSFRIDGIASRIVSRVPTYYVRLSFPFAILVVMRAAIPISIHFRH